MSGWVNVFFHPLGVFMVLCFFGRLCCWYIFITANCSVVTAVALWDPVSFERPSCRARFQGLRSSHFRKKVFCWHDSESHPLLPSISHFLKKDPTPREVHSRATFLFLGTLQQFSKCIFFFSHPLQLTHWVFICPALGYWLISSVFIESLASSCFCLIVSFAHRFPALYGPRCFAGIASAQLGQWRMAPPRPTARR